MNSAENNPISVCLPKGDALEPLSSLFDQINFQIEGYHTQNRSYRPLIKGIPVPVRAKIMAEKDVALQIAAGNYDIGFCGLDWVLEHQVRFPGTLLQIIQQLGINSKYIRICSAINAELNTTEDLLKYPDFITIVSEYPNLAEYFAIKNQLKQFKIFSAWGAVESYPPEHAELVLIAAKSDQHLADLGLKTITGHECDFTSETCLIVNRRHFFSKDLSPVLNYFKS